MSPITKTKVVSSDEWATPQWLFDKLHSEFRFTVDACAKPWNAKLPRYCTIEQDGLSTYFEHEVVWCNPPYSDIGPWAARAYDGARSHASTWVLLLPCVPDRKWWAAHVEGKATEVRHLTRSLLPSGRVHFEREDGSSDRAPFPSCLVVYRKAA